MFRAKPLTLGTAPAPLVEGIDYHVENGKWVFTAAYLLKRKRCCANGCRRCPYDRRVLPPKADPPE